MKKNYTLILLLLILVVSSYSQDYEYGKPEELKGLTKIFIDTGADMKSRELMVKELEKKQLGKLEILDSSDEAEIYLSFRGGSADGPITVTPNVFGSGQTTITPRTLRTGGGMVFIAGKDLKKPRLLLSGEYIQKGLLLDKPSEKFIKEFIKAYKKANSLK